MTGASRNDTLLKNAHPCRAVRPGMVGRYRVNSAFSAQASSTKSYPVAAAAMSAAAATLLSARGRPLATRCSRTIASSANNGSSRPVMAEVGG